ncbi:hypothetical protein H2200_005095 [Cladophialophora chaetospira]|uniref:Uncharacterized protein n=1 Tax=Cladophialophora chaetospira TaxID=386627 RepID=A0AA39CJK1_9EURO|nr:hypothetical protein H2200_005095 [Cladophialophora chaetospira]
MAAKASPVSNVLPGIAPVAFRNVDKPSIYTMIPAAVRSRIPVLTSLRQTARTVVLHGSRVRRGGYALTCVETTKEKESYSMATTASSGSSTPTTRPGTPDGSAPSQELSLAPLASLERQSGVNWDVALTGIRLWVTARAQATNEGDPVALRSMHIDALRYMHMALPPDLTPLEIQTLRASMPQQLLCQSKSADQAPNSQPNLLRQSIAQAVCWFIAGLLVIVPVIMTLLHRLVEFERQHQITERVLANGIQVTSSLGERGAELHQALVRFKAGRVGGACVDMGSWFVDGIVGGVTDGLDAVAQSQRRAS